MKPAIVVVGYSRPKSTLRLLNSIGNAIYDIDDIHLIVSIDECDKSNEVEEVANKFNWKYGTKTIIRFDQRQGLKNHIIKCGDLTKRYESIILLEDDLVVSRDFYLYTRKAHDYYNRYDEICGVALYSYSYNVFNHYNFIPEKNQFDVYLGQMVCTWGQSWTYKQWNSFKNWYIENEDKLPEVNNNLPKIVSTWKRSWGKYFATYMSEKNLSYIYPYVSRTTCFSDIGEHNSSKIALTYVQVPLSNTEQNQYNLGSPETLIRYDPFFDRIFYNQNQIAGIDSNLICNDINNMKSNLNGKKYILSNDDLKLSKIKSFGLSIRPIELNIIHEIPGENLFLYEINDNKKDNKIIRNKSIKSLYLKMCRLKYEFHDMLFRDLILYTNLEFIMKFKKIMRTLYKIIKI